MVENLIIYALKVSISIALFYGLHLLFLKNETFFRLRRVYFLLALAFSLSFPLISISWDNSSTENMPTAIYMLSEVEVFVTEQLQSNGQQTEQNQLMPAKLLLMIAALGTAVLLMRLLIQFVCLIINLRNCEWQKIDNYYLIQIENKTYSSYSFFRWIVLNTAGQTDRSLQDILRHERVHASQLHSIDVLLYELFCIAFWWNPFVWLMRREVKLNLEYIADEGVVCDQDDYRGYQHTLLQINIANTGMAFVNNFNVSQLKKRIIMMNKKRSSLFRSAKYLLTIPLALALVVGHIACSPKSVKEEIVEEAVLLKDEVVTEGVIKPVDKDRTVFEIVEEMPRFPAGEEAMMKYVAENLKYPETAQEAGINGRVVIRFVVEADGSVTDVTVLRGIDPACDEEAIRVIESMPKWSPGKQNGEAVAVYFNLPIVFKLRK